MYEDANILPNDLNDIQPGSYRCPDVKTFFTRPRFMGFEKMEINGKPVLVPHSKMKAYHVTHHSFPMISTTEK